MFGEWKVLPMMTGRVFENVVVQKTYVCVVNDDVFELKSVIYYR